MRSKHVLVFLCGEVMDNHRESFSGGILFHEKHTETRTGTAIVAEHLCVEHVLVRGFCETQSV